MVEFDVELSDTNFGEKDSASLKTQLMIYFTFLLICLR